MNNFGQPNNYGIPGNQFDISTMMGWGGGPLGSGNYAIPMTPSLPAPMPSGWMNSATNSNVPSFMQPGWKPGAPAEGGAGGILGGFFDTPDSKGWGSQAIGAAGSLASLFMGMKQYGLAKQTLTENKRQFDTNYAAQKGLTNASLEDRQRARVASNPGAYQSVGDYMAQNGVK